MLKAGQALTGKISRDKIEVLKELGSGGQGTVYLVKCRDMGNKAVKWYNSKSGTADQKLAIDRLIRGGPPDKGGKSSFVWPLDLVEEGTEFGYIMDVIDFNRYIPIGKMMGGKKENIPSLETKCCISLKLVSSFAGLHNRGYCYRDINDNNFMFDPITGDIVICDNDNIGFDGASKSNVIGMIDYMAPEIITGNGSVRPSKYTDYHSLAVLLFKFWAWGHPFEGMKEYNTRCWDRAAKVQVFGKNPVFIFHPTDKSNEVPNDPEYNYIRLMWEACPRELKELFGQAFVEGVRDAGKRVIEQKWIKTFRLLQDAITSCPHDRAENFWYDDGNGGENSIRCWSCAKTYNPPVRLRIRNRNNNIVISTIIARPGSRLMGRHLSINPDPAQGATVVGEIVRHPTDPDMYGLKNLSRDTWKFINSKGVSKEVPPMVTVPAFNNNSIDFGGNVTGVFEA